MRIYRIVGGAWDVPFAREELANGTWAVKWFLRSAELVTSVEAQRRFPGPPWGHACFGLILVCLSAPPESISRIDMVRTIARDIIFIDYSGR